MEGDKWHYASIKSLSRLLHGGNSKNTRKKHFCKNCLQGFTEESGGDKRYSYCIDNEAVKVEMPTKSKSIPKFSDGQGQLKAPFVIYADFESILEPIDGCGNDLTIPHINHVNKHAPSGFCTYSTFAHGKVKNPLNIYRGKDCVEKFCDHMRSEAHRNMFPEKPMDRSTHKQWKEYNEVQNCHICLKPINFTTKDPKVRDHCHYMGKCRDPAHRNCNIYYKVPSYIPVVFHNLSGYDTHLFIKEMAKHSTARKNIEVIAKNKENYISFSVQVLVDSYINKEGNERLKMIDLRFINSFKFMASSLDSFTNNLVCRGKKLFGLGYNPGRYNLLTRKRVHPYEYMDSWSKFNETELLPIECFYSKLNGSGIFEEDYEHAKNHNLYLKTDVILLASVFEEFRSTCMKHYRLDQAFNHRLILEHIHRVIEFKQSAWMKLYIDFNMQLRAKATNDFEKDFFKLLNNSVFGKMMENIRKHRNIKLVTNKKKFLKAVMKPNFK